MRVACGFDHAGVALRGRLLGLIVAAGHEVIDFGTDNTHPGATVDSYTAHQAVEHDDLNVLCLGGRVIGIEVAAEIVATFLAAGYTGEQRHVHRLAKVVEIERTGGRVDELVVSATGAIPIPGGSSVVRESGSRR
jgi:ribose 5-phosphate isomerase B